MATTLNDYALGTEALARINRATALGVLGASIAHEVKQPLASITTSAAACTRWLSAQPPDLARAQRALDRIASESARAKRIIEALCLLVKGEAPRKERCDLNAAILEVLDRIREELRCGDISLETVLAADLPRVECAGTQVQQVVLNLVVNAIQAMRAITERPRRLVVASSREGPDRARVEVRDSGPGVDPSQAHRMFEAFHTTKADGLGIGLTISSAIIEANGGWLSVAPNEPHGAVFGFSLPIEAAAPA